MARDIALVLGGGGFRGAVQVATIQALHERVAHYDGTSVGALNASMAAARRVDRLTQIWQSIDGIGSFMSSQLDAWAGRYSLRPTRKWLRREGALEPHESVSVGLYDYADGEHRSVPLNDLVPEEREDAIIASSSIPFIHERAAFRGRECGDGGIYAPVSPLTPSLARSFAEVHVVLCHPPPTVELPRLPQDAVNGPVERIMRSFDQSYRHTVRAAWARLRRLAKHVPTYVYAPKDWDEIGPAFEAPAELNQRRLHEVGPRMLRDRVRL